MPIRIESQSEPIPGYRLIERLGGGGFGEVWKAEAPGGLHKAIKFVYGDLQADDEQDVHRAEQELKALKRVQSVRHPYLLSLERYDIVEGRLLIVMELADRNLWDRFKEARAQGNTGIPRDELLRYMEEAAEVLDLMNGQYQLQHLDIKPQNLFLVHSHVKVADFGLVKDLEGKNVATVTGGVTPVYASPETFDGVVSPFSDQYSLAIVYQELLTGQRPFSGASVQQLIMQHLHGTPNLSALVTSDREVIARALAKEPKDRFPTCLEMVQKLKCVTRSEPAAPRPSAPTIPAAPPTRAETGASPSTAEKAKASGSGEISPSRGQKFPSWVPGLEAPAGGSTMDEPASRPPVVETTGDGVLFPAVVVALGQFGLEAVARLREALIDRFGSLQALPHLRFLYIDTDADTLAVVAKTYPNATPSGDEVILARLNRPSHYLTPREGRTRVEGWVNTRLIYRIPRNPATTGMRALGRLAFADYYRNIVGRLRADLEAVTQPSALVTAAHQTGLTLRTNWPRVYVVTSLGGGTGGGMFLDLAYVARHQLRRLGYDRPDVAGLLFLPEADRNPARALALGNAFAALTELNHFSSRQTTFTASFDEREPALHDPQPPFSRVVVLPVVADPQPALTRHAVALAGEFLCRELSTPLGRTADHCRSSLSRAVTANEVTCQSFGLYRFFWPRRAFLQRTARHICRQTVQRWAERENPALREALRPWVAEQWSKLLLAAEPTIERLQKHCERTLKQTPEAAFAALIDPLTPQAKRLAGLDFAGLRDALEKLELLVGRPDDRTKSRRLARLAEILAEAGNSLVRDLGGKLAQIPNCLIEQPAFRLAGAEEAIQQLHANIEQVITHYDPVHHDLADNANQAFDRIHSLAEALQANPAGRRGAATLAELIEVLRVYAKWRYQSLIVQRVTVLYTGLRNQLADQMREVGFSRQRLAELLRHFEQAAPGSRGSVGPIPGQRLLPVGCQALEDAVQGVLESITPQEFQEVDQAVQKLIEQQFTSLRQVCLAGGSVLKGLEQAMQQYVEGFVGPRVVGFNVTEMFFDKYREDGLAEEAFRNAFDEAAPELAGPALADAGQVCILAVPAEPGRDPLFDLARRALGGIDVTAAENTGDIVLYRELAFLPLARLEQLGQIALEAYRHMLSLDSFTPHSRMDITEWREPGT